MAFDIGIGKCRSVNNGTVEVWVDSSVVRRLIPDVEWKKAGVSLLKVPAALCSKIRPASQDKEVFLASEAIDARSSGYLDFHGTGEFKRVGLSKLVPTVSSTVPPATGNRKTTWR